MIDLHVVRSYNGSLMHHGVKGQEWYKHKFGKYQNHAEYASGSIDTNKKQAAIAVNDLSKRMKSISYDTTPPDRWRLKSASDVKNQKKGNCHDQVVFEVNELQKLGIEPKVKFLIEHNDSGQGGVTHSFVYFDTNNKKTIWFENAWEDQSGVHEMNSFDDIKKYIESSHNKGEFGSKEMFPNVSWGDLDIASLKPGLSLQDLLNEVKWDDD